MTEIKDILDFWFVECSPDQWFRKDSDFDKKLEKLFSASVEMALDNKLERWSSSKMGCLALILLLDQFTRNIFRETPRAFAGDKKALILSFKCKKNGYLKNENIHISHFMLLPMMHSEEISVQNTSLPIFKSLNNKNIYNYALRHREIIKRFGRFPHRNSILGRKSTAEEIEFLTHAGSRF